MNDVRVSMTIVTLAWVASCGGQVSQKAEGGSAAMDGATLGAAARRRARAPAAGALAAQERVDRVRLYLRS